VLVTVCCEVTVNLCYPRYDWYQTEANVVVTILVKKLPQDQFKHIVTDTTVSCLLFSTNLKFELNFVF